MGIGASDLKDLELGRPSEPLAGGGLVLPLVQLSTGLPQGWPGL